MAVSAAIGICVAIAAKGDDMSNFRFNSCCGSATRLGAVIISALVLHAAVPENSNRSVTVPRPTTAGVLERWSGGSLLRWRIDTLPSDPTNNLQVFDRSGTVTLQKRFWLPDAGIVKIHDVQQSGDGRLGLAGLAFTSSGQAAAFFGLIDIKTGAVTVVQTSPFEPQRVIFTADGSLWTLGFQMSPDRKITETVPHATFRRYSADGTELGEYLKWPAFSCGLHPAIVPRMFSSALGISVLFQQCNEWVDFSMTGQYTSPITLTDPPGKRKSDSFHGMAMTNGGDVYAGFAGSLYRLDRQKGAWSALPPGQAFDLILGSDGETLVVRRGEVLTWLPVGR